MRKTSLLLTIIVAFLFTACEDRKVSENDLLQAIRTTPMLYTVQCVAQTTVVERSSKIKDLFGQRTVVVPVEANIKAGIDLSALSAVKIEDKTVYITLPDPVIEIESTHILRDKIVTSVAPLRSAFKDDELSAIAGKGVENIKENLDRYDIVVPAQEQAEMVLAAIANKFGLTAVFRERPVYEKHDLVDFVKSHNEQ